MNNFGYQQFSTVIPFLFIMLLGILCGKNKIINSDSTKTIGYVSVNFLTPFMVVNYLQLDKTKENSSELTWAFVSAIIIFFLFYFTSYIFFLKKDNDASNVFACSLFSTSATIFAYPLLSNIAGCNAKIYTAVFILVNHLLFSIFSGKILYKKRNILKRIFTIPFIIEVFAVLMYFLNIRLILPIANTVEYISSMVPTLSAFLVGMYFSNFPLKGIKFQFEILIASAYKLLLFPILVFIVCLIAHFDIDTTLIFVTLSALPSGIELTTTTCFSQNDKTPFASNINALSFTLSLATIPLMCFITNEIYSIIY